ncbi:unnamed protein product [Adineta steineri]|uniref:SCP domain-containing protein n=1 Tax=Adineta steineri TaxID=433720 RepID=A0A820D3A5_9BILA|nr:unnamed protein product [Adineta steineri]CAF1504762.1 unnamed protein product [Adineta steineri]CAF4224961.1 unnamed protein product [Adineta steineri]
MDCSKLKGMLNIDLDSSNFHEFFYPNKYLERRMQSFTPAQKKFQREMLDAHNTNRSHHCTKSLQLDDRLSRSAQDYAQRLANLNKMVHSGTKGLGENLYMMSSSDKIANVNGSKVTGAWYDEIKEYNYTQPVFSMKTGHFTQVVWKDSQRLGVGFAFSNGGRSLFVVAQYEPPGNFLGAFDKNVLPQKC